MFYGLWLVRDIIKWNHVNDQTTNSTLVCHVSALCTWLIPNALCSRNFQNVKLRLDFVEIWSFYRHSDFTWNHIWGNSNSPEMLMLTILEHLNFDFSKLGQLSSHIFTKIQNSNFKITKNNNFGQFEFAKMWFHAKSEWR